MWPFSRKKKKERQHDGMLGLLYGQPIRSTKRTMKRVVAGIIIGGAIGSIIGKRLLEQRKADLDTLDDNSAQDSEGA